jgi:hypothetical protein
MLRFIAGLQVDSKGNSLPGAFFHTPEQQAEAQLREIQASRLDRVAASAEEKLYANPTNTDELDRFCQAKGLTVSQRIDVKRGVLERGETLAVAMKRQRL